MGCALCSLVVRRAVLVAGGVRAVKYIGKLECGDDLLIIALSDVLCRFFLAYLAVCRIMVFDLSANFWFAGIGCLFSKKL